MRNAPRAAKPGPCRHGQPDAQTAPTHLIPFVTHPLDVQQWIYAGHADIRDGRNQTAFARLSRVNLYLDGGVGQSLHLSELPTAARIRMGLAVLRATIRNDRARYSMMNRRRSAQSAGYRLAMSRGIGISCPHRQACPR